jgi:hypothetical protein
VIANYVFGTGRTTVCSLGIWRKGDPRMEGSRGSLKQGKSPGAAKRPLSTSTIVLRWERLTVRVRMKAEFYARELPRNRTSALRALTQRTSSAAMRSSHCRSASYPHCHTADRNLRPSHSAKDRQSSPAITKVQLIPEILAPPRSGGNQEKRERGRDVPSSLSPDILSQVGTRIHAVAG